MYFTTPHDYITLMTTLFALRCPLSDWCTYPDNRASALHDNQEFDYIVVGAGSAGSVVAARLSENKNVSVLLLEAGEYPITESEIPLLVFNTWQTAIDWNYTTEPSTNNCEAYEDGRCAWPRGRCLGGSSAINAMIYIRGNRKDFDSWEEAGNDNWGYDSIFKYFLKSEHLVTPDKLGANKHLYGSDGDQPIGIYSDQNEMRRVISEAAKQLGVSTVDAEGQLGFFNALQTINRGVRASPGKGFLGKHRDRTILIVSLSSTVERVLFDDNTATGVIAKINSKQLTLRAKKEVILSAGAINSPIILMNSGIGPRKHLKQMKINVKVDLPVGRNLQDHLINFGHLVTFAPKFYENHYSGLIYELIDYISDASGPFGKTGLLSFLGFINTKDNHTNYPNIEYHFIMFPNDDKSLLPIFLKKQRVPKKLSESIKEILKHRAGLFIWTTLLHPKSRGYINLNPKDPHGAPRIYPKYLSKIDDVDTLLEGIRFAEALVETDPFKAIDAKIENLPIGCEDFKFRSDDYWKCVLRKLGNTVYHPVGTCKMGRREDGGVVDSRLRVHGVSRLRVVDASIMPTITSGNTQAPCFMIGQKGADMIIEDNN